MLYVLVSVWLWNEIWKKDCLIFSKIFFVEEVVDKGKLIGEEVGLGCIDVLFIFGFLSIKEYGNNGFWCV